MGERFWSKVTLADDPKTCWEWTRSKRNGYGQFNLVGIPRATHRLAYTDTYGPIPDGMVVDHICHNRACVRPTHLRLLSPQANIQNRGGPNANNSSGHLGVRKCSVTGRFYGRVKVDGHEHHTPRFDTPAEADVAIQILRKQLTPHVSDRGEYKSNATRKRSLAKLSY